jgi:putative heme-binding domain-containing protein
MKPVFWIVAIAVGTEVSVLQAKTSAAPQKLASQAVGNALGLALNEYAFSWDAPAQTGYRVLVASDEKKLAADVGDLWDSGLRHSGKKSGILCRGRAMRPGTEVWWKVRSWNADAVPGEWSAPERFMVPATQSKRRQVPRPTSVSGKVRFVEGKIGQAIRIDGGVVSAQDYAGLRPSKGMTIAAWIKPEHITDSWQCIYRKEDGARRLLAIGKEGPHWGVWAGLVINGHYVEYGVPCDPKELGDGQWHHLASSFDGQELALYLDGREMGRKAYRGSLGNGDNSPAYLGSYKGSSEHFRGALDDLRVYARGLTRDEVGKLATADPQAVPEGLTAHWAFDGSARNAATFTPEAKAHRVVLLGGSLVHGMERHGYLEAAITSRWPNHNLGFRNLGWPADDVFGTARGEFGSARNTRSWQPPGAESDFGLSKMRKHIAEASPTALIVGFGAEAAYADTGAKMANFQAGYEKLITELEKTGARLILLTPIPQKKSGTVLPNPDQRNKRLRQAADFILQLAAKRKHLGVDLFTDDPQEPGGLDREDALHLSAKGYRQLAVRLSRHLGIAEELDLQVQAKDGHLTIRSETLHLGAFSRTRRGLRFDLFVDRLPAAGSPLSVSSAVQGAELWHDAEKVATLGDDTKGTTVSGGALFLRSEYLRKLIVEKNLLYRHKLRPINEAYIFLFRRHEMGHLAKEMDDFEELVAGKEEIIAKARVPEVHRYELRLPAQWKTPRAYPDHEVPKDLPAPDLAAELEAITVPEGFELNLFAANPMIQNPINLNWDRRGRAWVATSTTYPHIKPGKEPNDRIVILEDIDHDGVADKHTVFADGLTVPHSVMPGEGGAYVCSTTEFLFLADADGDDRSESRRVIFSGFGNADVHHMIHGLRWAPWGDLYFTQSIYINTFVDTAHGPRRMNGSGIWRFRPDTEQLDAYAVGMVNPWGFAFDDWGQSFGTDGAGGSGPHFVFPGAAFRTAVGAHRVLNGLIPGKPKNTAAEFVSGEHMPEHWRGSLLANDFRANRTVRYEIQEKGSSYVAKEVETVLHSSHRSFRPVDIKMGPDGAVYVVDWYNPIIDHGEVDFHHPSRDKVHGRIWRLAAKDRSLLKRETIAEAKPLALLDLLKSPAQYNRVRARRELARHDSAKVLPVLKKWLDALDPKDPDFEHHRLEGLWLVVAMRAAYPELAIEGLRSTVPQVRASAVRAISRWSERAGPIDKMVLLAQAVEDPHPRVRLEAVCALREIGTLEAANVALRALGQETDDYLSFALELTVRHLRDKWLPAMQAGKPVFDGNPSRLAYALKEVGDPRAIAPLVEVIQQGGIANADLPQAVTTVSTLGQTAELDAMLVLARKSPALLPSVATGAANNSHIPGQADAVIEFLTSKVRETRVAAVRLCGTWNVRSARDHLLQMTRSKSLHMEEATSLCFALGSLGATADLQHLSTAGNSPKVRAAAVAAWAKEDTTKAAGAASDLLASLTDSDTDEAEVVYAAFIGLREGIDGLAKALSKSKLRRPVAIAGVTLAHASGRDLTALISILNQAGGLQTLAQNLSPQERTKLLADAQKSGDALRGREIYHRKTLLCASCHLIENRGGRLGPDLSTVGSYMTPEAILESLIHPSSSIKQGYETVLVTTRDKALLSGLLQRKTDDAVLLRDPSGNITAIPNRDVAKIDVSPVSLMPPALTASLRRDEMLDLLCFLTSLGKKNP